MQIKVSNFYNDNDQIRLKFLSFDYSFLINEFSPINLDLFSSFICFCLLLDQDQKNETSTYFDISKLDGNKLSISRVKNKIIGFILLPQKDIDLNGSTLEIITQSKNGEKAISYVPIGENYLNSFEDFFTKSIQNRIHLSIIFNKSSHLITACLAELLPNSSLNNDNLIKLTKNITNIASIDRNTFEEIDSNIYDYECTCSEQIFLSYLKSLPRKELIQAASNNKVKVTCGSCNKEYVFDIKQL